MILIRSWNKEEDAYYYFNDGLYLTENELKEYQKNGLCYTDDEQDNNKNKFTWGESEQATGLKDKNGKMLFDGDIRKVFMPHWEDIEQIGYYGFKWVTYFKNSDGDLCLGDDLTDCSDFEIIGNIHDK